MDKDRRNLLKSLCLFPLIASCRPRLLRDMINELEPELKTLLDVDSRGLASQCMTYDLHPKLMAMIQETYGETGTKFVSTKKSYEYVPESQEEFSARYLDFCQDSIERVVNVTGMKNPYSEIIIPQTDYPHIHQDGVTAIIVNQLFDSTTCTYSFADAEGKERAPFFARHVRNYDAGFYETYYGLKNGVLAQEHLPYTVWQVSTPYKIHSFIAPTEETLHIMVRDAQYRFMEILTKEEGVKEALDHAIQIEEAVVGACALRIIGPTLSGMFSSSERDEELRQRRRLPNYKYLEQGIRVVDRIGVKDALSLYKEDPVALERLLGV